MQYELVGNVGGIFPQFEDTYHVEKSLDLLLVSTWLSSFWICGKQVVNAMTCADDLVVGNIVVCNNVYSSVAGSLDDDETL